LLSDIERVRNELRLSRSDAARKAFRLFLSERAADQTYRGAYIGTITLALEHQYGGGDHDHLALSAHSHTRQHAAESPAALGDLDTTYLTRRQRAAYHLQEALFQYHDIVGSTTQVYSDHHQLLMVVAVHGDAVRILELYHLLIQLDTVLSYDLFLAPAT
jgi:metal-responsive CopG/Arc/MetJ family transcriptional regulator